MKAVLFVALLVCFLAVVALAQTRPKPSEVFESEAHINVKRGNDTFRGEGKNSKYKKSTLSYVVNLQVNGE